MSPISATPNLGTRATTQSTGSRHSSEAAPSLPRPMTPSSVHSSSSETGDNDIIPPYHPAAPRTLVLCFDGTGDQFDSDNSNVVKFFSLLKRDDRREQMVYYQAGIGTYTSPRVFSSAGQAILKTLDEMVAWNLDAHVMGGYEFLMQNYEAGDKICLFGFSRGAYTARALAGMLHKVGLLPSHNFQQIPFAYKMYIRTDELGWKQSTAFKKAFSIDVDIDFIGVWDTVCSVGLIPQRLPFTASNTAIRVFRHALSLDERRARFKANHYNRPSEWEKKQGTHGDMPRPVQRHFTMRRSTTKTVQALERSKSTSPSRFAHLARGMTHAHGKEETSATGTTAVATSANTVTSVAAVEQEVVQTAERMGDDVEKVVEKSTEVAEAVAEVADANGVKLWKHAKGRFDTFRTLWRKKNGKRLSQEEDEFNKTDIINGETDVKEVWFAGCHCDVGGGSVADSEKHSLARIPLRWMVRECFRTNTGIRFHAELLKDVGLDPQNLWPHVKDPYEFGPGLEHAPQIPPLHPSPRISLDPPTPPEKSRQDVESKYVHANGIFAHPPTVSHASPPSSTASSTLSHSHAPEHARHVSISTTRTVVGSSPTAQQVAHAEPAAELDVNEAKEEREDALCPIYDQLSLHPWWWILEVLPIKQRKQLKNNTWKKYLAINLGHGRTVPPYTEHFYVHHSVKLRMEEQNLPGGLYKPKAKWDNKLQPIYVD
ncbi:hypothetical protein DICSQDRAFT_77001 [Dichomitus squalens LYAD-421 SS1]|uniref:uncharacterized protein n=1 Tax=Dichomitus squalens (strain LYAD-421) TaxID=732165 RepID=UPI0004412AD1|nr:uncharacterized protein DICSQDRAFT_77001 [Dichomitus squalens LYAD-421 SS1]EJF67348.1 hypothetical protein DICSQDRAFT_77001 [Dichomitus squalens LYAD-421 SS1]